MTCPGSCSHLVGGLSLVLFDCKVVVSPQREEMQGFGGEFGAKKGASWAWTQHFALTPGQRELGLADGDQQEASRAESGGGAAWLSLG